jgi:tetratricopeptide (TPR) repeat protein
MDLSLFDVHELLALAQDDIDNKRFSEALFKVKTALAMPKPPNDLLAVAAKLYGQLRLFDKAKALFNRYLEQEPQATHERFQLGMVHFDNGETEAALTIWGHLLEQHPVHPPARYYSALANSKIVDWIAAQKHLDILLKSVAADNMYFGMGKELLTAIQNESFRDAETQNDTNEERLLEKYQ